MNAYQNVMNQLISLLESFRKLYIMTEYHNFMLLFLNLGWVVNFTQSFLITFFNVSQQLKVAKPRSLANSLMLLPTISSIPYFSKARSWYQIILNFLQICHKRKRLFRNSKGKQLNLNIQKLPRTKNGSLQGASFLRVTLANIHLHTLTVTRGIFKVKRLTILLMVQVPVTKSPPPKNQSTLMSQSDEKVLQSRYLSRSSMISKNPSLKNSYLLNSKGSSLRCVRMTSVSLSMRKRWLQN